MPGLSSLGNLTPYHVLTYGTLLGTQIFHSFIGGPIAFKILPRPSFAHLQSSIFPIYFGMQTALPAILALTYPLSASRTGGFNAVLQEHNRWTVLVPLFINFLGGLANLVFIGPATTKVMRARKSQEYKDGKKSYDPPPHSEAMRALNKKFGILHGVSSLVNLVAIVSTIVYGFTLAEMLG